MALSSAYEWLYQAVRALRLNVTTLAAAIGEATSVGVLRETARSALMGLFDHCELSWHPAYYITLLPP